MTTEQIKELLENLSRRGIAVTVARDGDVSKALQYVWGGTPAEPTSEEHALLKDNIDEVAKILDDGFRATTNK